MKYSLLPRLLVAAALLTTTSLTSCNTGNDTGDTNVERDAAKDNDSNDLQTGTAAGDSATSGTRPDTSTAPSTRQVYEEAADRKDRNNDGIAD
jgi:predicted small secreted protein